jgi:hypothetical protein
MMKIGNVSQGSSGALAGSLEKVKVPVVALFDHRP